eukprot:3108758-Rhodomonas_salina.2
MAQEGRRRWHRKAVGDGIGRPEGSTSSIGSERREPALNACEHPAVPYASSVPNSPRQSQHNTLAQYCARHAASIAAQYASSVPHSSSAIAAPYACSGPGSRVQGPGSRVQGLGPRAQGPGSGLGCRIYVAKGQGSRIPGGLQSERRVIRATLAKVPISASSGILT